MGKYTLQKGAHSLVVFYFIFKSDKQNEVELIKLFIAHSNMFERKRESLDRRRHHKSDCHKFVNIEKGIIVCLYVLLKPKQGSLCYVMGAVLCRQQELHGSLEFSATVGKTLRHRQATI